MRDNPEYERSIAEREEFFAGQDARTLNFNGIPQQPPIAWSTGAWNGPLIELDPNDPFGDLERIFRRGIHVTAIVPPEQGWPVAFHCPICKETTFLLSPWAIKPEKGDYWRINETCGSEEHHMQHNMRMAMKPITYRPLPGGYLDETGPHRGVPPGVNASLMHRLLFGPYDAEVVQEMTIEEAKRRYPNTPIPGDENESS